MRKLPAFAIVLVLASLRLAEAAPLTWQPLAPGLAYAKVAISGAAGQGVVHAFRMDPARYRLDTLLAKDHGTKLATVRDMAGRAKALVAINGGFFSPLFEPLGLRIQSGHERAPLKATSWWGVFFVQNGAARIAARGEFAPVGGIHMAVQSGPRLVVAGTIPPLKGGVAERSAVGIARGGEIVLAVTERTPMDMTTWAELFRRSAAGGGLDCPNALNLDGGGSAQLAARVGRFALDVPGLTPVTDAVGVFAR